MNLRRIFSFRINSRQNWLVVIEQQELIEVLVELKCYDESIMGAIILNVEL